MKSKTKRRSVKIEHVEELFLTALECLNHGPDQLMMPMNGTVRGGGRPYRVGDRLHDALEKVAPGLGMTLNKGAAKRSRSKEKKR